MAKKFLPQNQIATATPVTTRVSTAATINGNTTITIGSSSAGYNGQYVVSPSTQVAEILRELLDSKFEFFLGGSRAMFKRGADIPIFENTDYDFYATYSAGIEKFLMSLNFSAPVYKQDYLDTEVVSIYKSAQIDVVLRKDAKFYKSVFDNIKTDMYVKHLWKRNPQCDRSKITPLFNELFKIAHNNAEIKQELAVDDKLNNTTDTPDSKFIGFKNIPDVYVYPYNI